MAIEVGDAVFTFLGDSSNLDTKFSEVGPNAEKAFAPAAAAAEDASERMQYSMSAARGEVRLLGEEIGVRLPRHVGNFLAELPGVGPALSAAFSATAVLFLAQALVQITGKVTDLIASHFIYTQAMKDSNSSLVETNKLLLEQSANYNKAKEALDRFGAGGSDALRLQLAALQDQLSTQKQLLALAPAQLAQEEQKKAQYQQQGGVVHQTWDVVRSWISGTKNQYELNKANVEVAQDHLRVTTATAKALQEQEALLTKQLETEHALEAIRQGGEANSAAARLKAAKAESEVAEDSETAAKRAKIAQQLEDTLYQIKRDGGLKQLAILRENNDNTKDAQLKLLTQLKAEADAQLTIVVERMTKQKDEIFKFLQDVSLAGRDFKLPPIIDGANLNNFQLGRDAAHNLGITLKEDLVKAFEAAKRAQDDFMKSGLQDGVAQTAIANDILKAKAALDAYGSSVDKFKAKSHGLWNEFRTDTKEGATAMDQVKQLGVTAFDSLSKGLESAIASALLAQGSFTKALEKATASALASLASQALVKSLFYTAEGFAALAGYEESSASEYFTAAAEMAAVGAAAGLAAHAMSGGGGGSSKSIYQNNSGGSNTSSAGGGGTSVVGVQHFAEGGLITAPTLAMIGEQSRTEAVLPLEDPSAMGAIGKSISEAGGGGGIHIHMPHGSIISADTMQKFVSKMNKMVERGQLNVKASSSLRVNKRSA
jgi:hypothetical protein